MPGTEPKASGDCFATARVQLLFGQTFATLCQLECGFNRRTKKNEKETLSMTFISWLGLAVVLLGKVKGFKKRKILSFVGFNDAVCPLAGEIDSPRWCWCGHEG